jgi:predicted alpha-1,6-mannanase (GH76 family)
MTTLRIITASVMFLLLQSCHKDLNQDTGTGSGGTGTQYQLNWSAVADSSSMSVVNKFWNPSGNYFNKNNANDVTFNYWPQAHALDVLVDAYVRSGNSSYKTYIDSWFTGVKAKNGNTFINEFYDDMDWNALAMLRAYNATNDAKFKTATEEVWTDIKTGWNNIMGGGIAWRKSQMYYKNTPANAPAAILAARLYQQFNNPSDLEWSKKIYGWVRDSLYNPGSGWVFDGMNSDNDGKRNTTWKFTYNQGVFIGAALELYKITNEQRYLNDAIAAANFTLSDPSLTNFSDNLLRDEGNGDGGLFKGVFVRYFTQLILTPNLPTSEKQRYINFLKFNAEMLWRQGTDKSNILFGSYWKNKPTSSIDLTTHLSGAMLIEAAALLKKNNAF